MKSKIIAMMLSVLLMLQGVALADFEMGAGDVLELSGNASKYENVVIVLLDSENLDSVDALNETATIQAYNALLEGGTLATTNEIFYFANAQADENGRWTYDVPMSLGGANIKKLTLVTSTGDAEFINYASADYRTNGMLPAIKAAANNAGLPGTEEDDYDALNESLDDNIYFVYGNYKLLRRT